MLIPNRTIPRLAAATLVLGGCGSDGPTPGSVAAIRCEAIQICNPADFDDYYGTVAACRTELTERLEHDIEAYYEYYGDACVDAVLDYKECVAKQTRRTCSEYAAEDACEAMYDIADSLCSD